MKESFVDAAEPLTTAGLIELSRLPIGHKILQKKTPKGTAKNFQSFSLACNETTGTTNASQTGLCVCGITARFATEAGIAVFANHAWLRMYYCPNQL